MQTVDMHSCSLVAFSQHICCVNTTLVKTCCIYATYRHGSPLACLWVHGVTTNHAQDNKKQAQVMSINLTKIDLNQGCVYPVSMSVIICCFFTTTLVICCIKTTLLPARGRKSLIAIVKYKWVTKFNQISVTCS